MYVLQGVAIADPMGGREGLAPEAGHTEKSPHSKHKNQSK